MSYDTKQTRVRNTTINRQKVQVTADFGMTYIMGNAQPYFTITGEVRKLTKKGQPFKGERGVISCGAVLDEIRKAFKTSLAPAVRWHLTGQNGLPMHYLANAGYWREMLQGRHENTRRCHDVARVAAFASTVVWGACESDSDQDLESLLQEEGPWKASRLYEYLVERQGALKAAFDADMAAIGVECITEEAQSKEDERVYRSALRGSLEHRGLRAALPPCKVAAAAYVSEKLGRPFELETPTC